MYTRILLMGWCVKSSVEKYLSFLYDFLMLFFIQNVTSSSSLCSLETTLLCFSRRATSRDLDNNDWCRSEATKAEESVTIVAAECDFDSGGRCLHAVPHRR